MYTSYILPSVIVYRQMYVSGHSVLPRVQWFTVKTRSISVGQHACSAKFAIDQFSHILYGSTQNKSNVILSRTDPHEGREEIISLQILFFKLKIEKLKHLPLPTLPPYEVDIIKVVCSVCECICVYVSFSVIHNAFVTISLFGWMLK